MGLRDIYSESLEVAGRMKNLLIFFMAAHVVFLIFGEWTVAREFPYVIELREIQFKEIREATFLKPLTGPLADNLPLKILYTFSFNLVVGAFISTTVSGFLLFFLPYLIAVWRGFIIGVLFYGIDSSPVVPVIFYGTFILEFGAYSLSSAAGTDLGLSFLIPARKGADNRKEALKRAWSDTRKLYFYVVILLFIGAVWEMGMLHYFAPLTETLPVTEAPG